MCRERRSLGGGLVRGSYGSSSSSFSWDFGGCGESADGVDVTGEALMEASASDAAFLAKKAEFLSRVLGLGTLLHASDAAEDEIDSSDRRQQHAEGRPPLLPCECF